MRFEASSKHDFGIPDEITYLNCAYMSPAHIRVKEAGHRAIESKSRPWQITSQQFFTESDTARQHFARLLGGDSAGVSILPSVSYGIGTAAANLKLRSGHKVVLLAEQFPSNTYPWIDLAKCREGELMFVERPSHGSWTDAVLAAIDERTDLVALPHCHWTDGRLLDLERIGAQCARLSLPLVLDVTQSLGVLSIDLDRVQPAFVVAAAYKWLLGPYSLAFMWVAPPYRLGRPLELNWIAREGSERFSDLVNYRDALRSDAQRYDVGERSNFTLLPMATTALDMICEWQPNQIAHSLRGITNGIAERALEMGFQVNEPEERAPHLIGLRWPPGLPPNLTLQLASNNVFVSARGNAIRIAPHLYNDESDVERLFAELKRLL